VIFTTSPDALFSSYTPDMIPQKDSKLMIRFETDDMMEETLILLRFNCPDSQCDYTATGWGDLKLHVRDTHKKMMWYVDKYLILHTERGPLVSLQVIFVSGPRRFSLMNMLCTPRTFSLYTCHRCCIALRNRRQKSL
jgi:hypothetical protein